MTVSKCPTCGAQGSWEHFVGGSSLCKDAWHNPTERPEERDSLYRALVDAEKRILDLEEENERLRRRERLEELKGYGLTALVKRLEEALRDRCYGDTPVCYTEASGYYGCICWTTGPRPSDTERPMLAPTAEQKAAYLRQQEGPTVALEDLVSPSDEG